MPNFGVVYNIACTHRGKRPELRLSREALLIPRAMSLQVQFSNISSITTPYLDFFQQLGHLMEVESRVNGTVHTLHGQRLVGSQRFQVGEVRLWRKGRAVEGSFSWMANPELS